MSSFSNDLGPEEEERLAILLEEMGEALQAIGKIQRHGYESRNPTKAGSPTNRAMLEKELGDVRAAMVLMMAADDVDEDRITARVLPKLRKLERYAHHTRDTVAAMILWWEGLRKHPHLALKRDTPE